MAKVFAAFAGPPNEADQVTSRELEINVNGLPGNVVTAAPGDTITDESGAEVLGVLLGSFPGSTNLVISHRDINAAGRSEVTATHFTVPADQPKAPPDQPQPTAPEPTVPRAPDPLRLFTLPDEPVAA
jgi:hypothetical protein